MSRRLAVGLIMVGAVLIALVVSAWVSSAGLCSLGTGPEVCQRSAILRHVLIAAPGTMMVLVGIFLLARKRM